MGRYLCRHNAQWDFYLSTSLQQMSALFIRQDGHQLGKVRNETYGTRFRINIFGASAWTVSLFYSISLQRDTLDAVVELLRQKTVPEGLQQENVKLQRTLRMGIWYTKTHQRKHIDIWS